MISERRSALLAASSWDKRQSMMNSEEGATPKTSLKDRLAALTRSTDNWQNRVRKDDDVQMLSPATRRMTSSTIRPVRQSTAANKENCSYRESPVTALKRKEELPAPSKVGLLLNTDKGLETFFPATTSSQTKTVSESIDMDLDSIETTEILRTPRRPKPRCTGKRPRRENIIAKIDTTSVVIQEDPRDHLAPLSVTSDEDEESAKIAKSAKEGLQAIEDYTAVKDTLKQANTVSPYPAVMLIQVKGEKKVDVRLVVPKPSSVHQEGVFILVTPERLLKYEGEDSNILEKTKASQICIAITSKGDLHCSAKKVENVSGSNSSFFRLLGGDAPALEDQRYFQPEPFEMTAAAANIVLRITDEYKLQTVSKGERVRFDMLQSNATLIFDFGSEIYVWSGRNARKTSGKYATEYANQLRQKKVTNSSLIFGEELNDGGRGEWILHRRIYQGVQDILFSSKFSDWQTNELKAYGSPMTPRTKTYFASPSRNYKEEARTLADRLKSLRHPEPVTVVEDQELCRQMKDVVSENHRYWVLDGEDLAEIPETSVFCYDKCYVIRWQYRIQLSGVRRLRTGVEAEKETGRERVLYFYWLGSKTTAKQQGLCALKLSHMDKEKHPHIRVSQWSESALFLNQFKGNFVVRSSDNTSSSRLFLVQGAIGDESHLMEIDASQPLRSHASYVKIDKGSVAMLAGVDSRESIVGGGLSLAEKLIETEEVKTSTSEVRTIVQGDDDSVSWITASGRSKAPRFFRIYESEANELICPQYHKDLEFPITQKMLTDTVLVDAGDKLWIWSEKAPTTFSLRVAEYYWTRDSSSATVILKHSEPQEFRALFAFWDEWEEPESEGSSPKSPPRALNDLMNERTQCYPLADLRTRTNLPEGIDTTSLEQYLNDVEFQQTFKMSREAFTQLPIWKQVRLRKDAGLF